MRGYVVIPLNPGSAPRPLFPVGGAAVLYTHKFPARQVDLHAIQKDPLCLEEFATAATATTTATAGGTRPGTEQQPIPVRKDG